jgi:hypothetical protein
MVEQLHEHRRVLERVADVEWGRETEAWAAVALVAVTRAVAALDNLLVSAAGPSTDATVTPLSGPGVPPQRPREQP